MSFKNAVNVSVIVALGLIFSGCVYRDDPVDLVVEDYRPSPKASADRCEVETARSTTDSRSGYPCEWFPPSSVERGWTAIIIHHSATSNGNATIFDRWHKEGRNWDGIGYDFVIGNGSDSRDGEVEVTFRWKQQRTGAHCGGTPGNWANREGIGICLVGNFDKERPTPGQLKSLRRLVSFLQKRYNIPTSRVYGHGQTPGANSTSCPGKYFPMRKFKDLLSH